MRNTCKKEMKFRFGLAWIYDPRALILSRTIVRETMGREGKSIQQMMR